MATHSSILAWEIPWTEEPGGLQSMGLQCLLTEVWVFLWMGGDVGTPADGGRGVRVPPGIISQAVSSFLGSPTQPPELVFQQGVDWLTLSWGGRLWALSGLLPDSEPSLIPQFIHL